jgi:glycosyltransferase 2 family protein
VKSLQIVIGLVISLVCGYFAVRGVEWSAVWTAFQKMEFLALIPAMGCLAVMLLVRAYRWQRFVEPLQPVPFAPFLSATLIGFMANDVLPLRAGELIRVYALARLASVRISTALATVVLERVWDTVGVSILLVVLLLNFPIPTWLARVNLVIFAGSILVLVMGWILARRGEAGLTWLPPRIAAIAGHFVHGFSALRSPSLVVWAFVLSVLIWTSLVTFYWILLRACGFSLPVTASLMVTVLTVFAAALPAAPGYVGTFQYATVLALSFFSIPKEEALGFSIVAHVGQLLPVIIAGFVELLRTRLPLWPVRVIMKKQTLRPLGKPTTSVPPVSP